MKKIGITTTIPVEILIAKGYTPIDLNNLFISDKNYFKYIDVAEKDGFPKSTCAYIKGIYGVCIENGINEVVGVLEGDCSNTKALLDVLRLNGTKIYPFSFPSSHNIKDIEKEIKKFIDLFGVGLEEVEATRHSLGQIRDMVKKIDYLTFTDGKTTGFENHLYQVSMSDFGKDFNLFKKDIELTLANIENRKPIRFPIRLGFIGVPPMTADLYTFVENFAASFVYNEVQREFAFPRWNKACDIFEQYYDYTYPYDIEFRLQEINSQIEIRQIDAIIHYTQAFCYRAIEDIVIRKNLSVPVLTLEGDKLNVLDARTKLRIEAFLDMLLDSKEDKTRILGIDIGSREVKIALMDKGLITTKTKMGTMSFYRDFCKFDGKIKVDMSKFDFGKIDIGVSTGYGRNNTDIDKFIPINELKAHVYGAMEKTGEKNFVLLDIGGQDVKIVRVQNSLITDLELNDKCAASCGRYLENMANVLEIDLLQMTKHYKNPVQLNSTCSVFSESELIGKIAEGSSLESLCAGVNFSLYKRLQPLLVKFRSRKLFLSGGVARGIAIKKFLEEDFHEVFAIEDPQFNGAVGCCVYGDYRGKKLLEVV